MAVTYTKGSTTPDAAAARGTRFPGFDLKSSVEVARVLHMKGGGQASPDQMAAHLGYKGTNNGAYLTRVAAAVAFTLIAKNGPVFVLTNLAHQILSPTYPHDLKKAAVDAFLSVPLFKSIYEDFKGKELPPEFGMKNALKLTYKVSANRVNDAYRSLMESADTAGFFETKNGARTHLIMPLIQAIPSMAMPQADLPPAATEFGSGNGGGEGGGVDAGMQKPSVSGMDDVKAKYLSTLIKLFEDKATKGDVDEKLMERIERLIGASPNAV